MKYRSPLNFNDASLQAAKNSLKRIDRALTRLSNIINSSTTISDAPSVAKNWNPEDVAESMQEFESAMADDLNCPRAMAHFFRVIKLAEKLANEAENKLGGSMIGYAKVLQDTIMNMDKVLGVVYEVPLAFFTTPETRDSDIGGNASSGCSCRVLHDPAVTEHVKSLAERRAKMKDEKRFVEADNLREQIRDLGYEVKDFKEGFDIIPL
jgi:cysteinyl-tRNA synthetase